MSCISSCKMNSVHISHVTITWEPTGILSAGTGTLESFLQGKLHALNFYTNLVKSALCAEKIQAQQLDPRAAGRQINERGAPLLSLSPTPLHVCSHMCFHLAPCALENPLCERVAVKTHFRKGELVSIKQHMAISKKGEFGVFYM